jgi:hypothetical protein
MVEHGKRRRTTRLSSPILTVADFSDYPGLYDWLQMQAISHARTPAQEIVYMVMQRKDRHKRQGKGGRFTQQVDTPAPPVNNDGQEVKWDLRGLPQK